MLRRLPHLHQQLGQLVFAYRRGVPEPVALALEFVLGQHHLDVVLRKICTCAKDWEREVCLQIAPEIALHVQKLAQAEVVFEASQHWQYIEELGLGLIEGVQTRQSLPIALAAPGLNFFPWKPYGSVRLEI